MTAQVIHAFSKTPEEFQMDVDDELKEWLKLGVQVNPGIVMDDVEVRRLVDVGQADFYDKVEGYWRAWRLGAQVRTDETRKQVKDLMTRKYPDTARRSIA